jgi:hypothetical protein
MFYFFCGISFVIAGIRLLASEDGVLSHSLPFYFGHYKDVAGVVFCALGTVLLKFAIKTPQK